MDATTGKSASSSAESGTAPAGFTGGAAGAWRATQAARTFASGKPLDQAAATAAAMKLIPAVPVGLGLGAPRAATSGQDEVKRQRLA